MFQTWPGCFAQLFVCGLAFAVVPIQQSLAASTYWQETNATSSPPTGAASDDPLGESRQKAMRYHRALQSRPGPGKLFDLFYDTWLESASFVELESFLQKNSTERLSWEDQAILACFYSKQREHVRALQLFELALQQAPHQSHLWYEKARLSVETLNHDQALLDLSRAAESNEAFHRDRELRLKIVRQQTAILRSRGNTSEAFTAWNQLLDLHPNDELLFEDVIDQQVSLGAWDQALATSNRLLRLTTDPYQLVTRRMRHGTILHQSGKSPIAIELYGETFNLVGRDSWQERELISRIRQQYQQMDDIVGLRDCWKSLLIAEPDRVALRCELADAHQQLGQIEESIAIWQQIVSVTPGERRYRESLLAALVVGGRLQMAATQLESLLEYFPDDASLLLQLADYQQQLGQAGLVGGILDRFLEKSKHAESAYLQVAKHFEQHGPGEFVRHSFERGIAKNPDSTTLKDRLAHWFYQNNDKPTAIQQWRTRAAAADETERMRLARVLISLEEHQAAQEILLNHADPQHSSMQYLGLMIDASIERQEFERVIPWLRRNAARSDSWSDLEPTIQQAMDVVRKLVNPSILLKAFGESDLASDIKAVNELNVGVACVLTRLLIHEGKYREAKALMDDLDAFWSQRPTDNSRCIEMVLIQQLEYFRHLNDGPATLAVLQRLIQLPTSRRPQHFTKLVDLAVRADRLDEALQAIRKWKQIQTNNSIPWIMESQLLNRLQLRSESLEVLRSAISRFPHELALVQLLAENCVDQGLNVEAEHLYWKLFDRSPDPKVRLQSIRPLAMLDGREDSNSRVENILLGRLATNPESLDLQLALAEFYSLTGRVDKQQDLLRTASRKHPNDLTILNQTVALALTRGQWDVAIEALNRIHELAPFGPPTWQLIELYLHTGQLAPAVDLIREFMISHKSSPREVEAVVF